MVIRVELEGGAVQVVGAALNLDVDRGSASQALLRIEAVGNDIDGFDGFQGWHKGGYVRQPRGVIGGAVDPGVIDAVTGAIHVEGESPRRVTGHGVSIGGRPEPGYGS